MSNRRSMRRIGGSARIAAIALALLTAGCAGVSREVVYEQNRTKVVLRSYRGEEPEFQHPVTVSPVRIAHILSRIDVRRPVDEGQKREPAIPIETLYDIADGLVEGLSKANPNQQVVVYSLKRDRSLGLFDKNYLTSFISYMRNGLLYIHLSRSDWQVPRRREENLPDPEIGKFPMKFRVLPGQAMEVVDEQALAINWRDDVFSQPTRTRTTPEGKVVRRIILMESEDDTEELPPPEPTVDSAIPAGVSSDTLRDLANLEDLRRGGVISEAQYAERRKQILQADPASQPDSPGEDPN